MKTNSTANTTKNTTNNKANKAAKGATIAAKDKATTSAARTVNKQREAIKAAFDARIAKSDNANMTKFLQKMKANFLNLTDAQLNEAHNVSIDIDTLCKRLAVSDSANNEFIAQYAVEKIIKTIRALAASSVESLDKYTFSIVKNLHTLQKLDNMNAQRALCSKIELDELAQAQAIKVYHNCAPSTASTQASSTRMMLQALNICNVTKRSKSDSISFTDSATAKRMRALFA